MSAEVDVLVAGGGIHGCAIAQAAAACGYRTLLVEQGIVAGGTSSRSSKLIHGGLRYLETLQLPLVYEALQERAALLRIAPHLVRKQAFYIPVYRGSLRQPWAVGAGLSLYALLAFGASPFRIIPRQRWGEVLPDLNRHGLRALFQYWDAATDDARLTRAVAASARQLGAEIREFTTLLHARHDGNYWTVDIGWGAPITARLLVNAAGPWVEEVQRRIVSAPALPPLDYVQGAHIVLPQLQEAFVYVEAQNRRAVFIMPWQGQTLLGTTETAFSGNPAEVSPTPSEIQELCETYRRYYPQRSCNAASLAGSFAGIRVMPRTAGSFTGRSRSTLLIADRERQPTLLTVCGGKLTTYRRTGEKAMQWLQSSLPPPKRRVDTAHLTLPEVD